MANRIVRLEEDFWRIRPDEGELDAVELEELREYFNEVRFPYQIHKGRLVVPGTIPWETLYERLQHFYHGRAEVYPF